MPCGLRIAQFGPSSPLKNSRFQIGRHRSTGKAASDPRSCSYTGDLLTQPDGLWRLNWR
jgi:hypothetical protein